MMERRNEGDRTIVSGFTRRHKLNPDSKTPAFQDAHHRSVLRRTSGVLVVILAGLLGGITVAFDNVYAGYRLTDYRWSKKVPDRNRETFNAVVPGLVIGIVETAGQRANLVAEFNVTRFPERLRGSFGAGVRIQLGALWNR